MANAITTPIRQSADRGRQPREVRQKGQRKIDRPITAVADLVVSEIVKLNEAGKALRYDSKAVFNSQFHLWVVRFVEKKKHRSYKYRCHFARKVVRVLVSDRRIVLKAGDGNRVSVYASNFLAQQQEAERKLAMAAHPSTGANVVPIRKAVAA
jgi:hypothetical protein